ncbi:hypothetical protein O3M35_007790 [Rhynocoris fuscipes]|uniref:Uncharacterized protein n=1 Tax=Rhynocoris fuscipes TaxID=488301 RepID=A0AAW1DD61_9HEMI
MESDNLEDTNIREFLVNDIDLNDSKCEEVAQDWRPLPRPEDIIRWKIWQKKGKIRLKKEAEVTKKGWEILEKSRTYKVQLPAETPELKDYNLVENGNEKEDHVEEIDENEAEVEEEFSTDFATDEILIRELADDEPCIVKKHRKPCSESLLELINLYFPDDKGELGEEEQEYEEDKLNIQSKQILTDDYDDFGDEESDYWKYEVPCPQIQITPHIEIPEKKKYPLTVESKIKYKEKYLQEDNLEKEKIYNELMNRIENLKELRREILRQNAFYNCHAEIKKQTQIKRKQKFLKKLAAEKNFNQNMLERFGDQLYNAHKENLRKARLKHLSHVENELKQIEAMLVEVCEYKLKRKLNEKEELYKAQLKQKLSQENKKFPLDYLFKLEDKIQLRKRKFLKRKSRKTKTRKLRREKKSELSEDPEEEVGEEISEIVVEEHKKAKQLKEKGVTFERDEQVIPVVAGKDSDMSLHPPPAPEYQSIFDPEIIESFQKFDKLSFEKADWIERWYKPEENYPIEDHVAFMPKSLVIESFIPHKIYKKKITITNESGSRMHLISMGVRPISVSLDRDLIRVEPDESCSLLPGIPAVRYIIFEPTFDTTTTEAEVLFLTRRSDKDIRTLCLNILCTQQRAVPELSTTTIKFPCVKVWSKDIMTKVLTIRNTGGLPFSARISAITDEIEDDIKILSEFEGSIGTEAENETNIPSTRNSLSGGQTPASASLISLPGRLPIKKRRRQKKLIRRKLMHIIIKEIMENILDDVFDCVRIFPKYHLHVPPSSSVKVDIKFKPLLVPHAGVYFRKYLIVYEGINVNTNEQEFSVEAETAEGPFEVNPVALDLMLCLPGGGVYQTPFVVKNRGVLTYQLLIKVPRMISNHIFVSPSSPIIKPGLTEKILVRFAPKWSFPVDAGKYFNEENSIFEIPILITSRKEEDTGKALTLYALGILAKTMGIRLHPKVLDLGVVTTAETVVAVIYLNNYSQASYSYGFMKTPKCIMIQPNYGFGKIHAGESMKLNLLYSPGKEQILQPGHTMRHSFTVSCTTADRVACEAANVNIQFDNGDNHLTEFPITLEKVDSTTVLDKNKRRVKRRQIMLNSKEGTKLKNSLFQMHIPDLLVGSSAVSVSSSTASPVNQKKKISPKPAVQTEIGRDAMKEESEVVGWEIPEMMFDSISITAIVIDPICELSAQKVIMPPTPCYSFSTANIYIRAPNQTSLKACFCGIIKSIEDSTSPDIIARFELFSDKSQLEVEPCKGKIKIGESAKIYFILKPYLNETEVEDYARRKKAAEMESKQLEDWWKEKNKRDEKLRQKEEQKQKEQQLKSKNSKKRKDKQKTSSSNIKQSRSKVVKIRRSSKMNSIFARHKNKRTLRLSEVPPNFNVDPAKVTITKEDKINAKIDILKMSDASGFEAKVRCLVQTCSNQKPEITRNEVLQCNVICPVIKPDMLVTTPEDSPTLNFGPVAIGTKGRKWIQVHNIRGRNIFVKRTLLDTDGLFYCPFVMNLLSILTPYNQNKGIMVEPDHTLELPIFFSPNKEQTEMRFFELYSRDTVVPLRVIGKGVRAQFTIKPTFKYVQVSAPYNDVKEIVINIDNLCEAPLCFSFIHLRTKQGFEVTPPVTEGTTDTPRTENNNKVNKTGGKSKKENTAKSRSKKDTAGKANDSKLVDLNFTDEIPKYLLDAFENDFVEISGPDPYFQIPDTVTIKGKTKGKIKILFTPPIKDVIKRSSAAVSATRSSKDVLLTPLDRKKTPSKRFYKRKEIQANQVYVTEVRLMMGDVIDLGERIIIGTCTKGATKQSNRSVGKRTQTGTKKKK